MDPTAIITALISVVGGYTLGHFTILQWLTSVFSIIGFMAGILRVLVAMGLPLQSEVKWVDVVLAFWSKLAMHPAAAKARQPGLPAKALAMKLAAKTSPGGTPAPKGFATLGLMLIVTLALATLCSCATVGASQWTTPTFATGPSVALTEVSPKNPNPVSVASGAGWQVCVEDGQFALKGAQWSYLTVCGLALGSVIAPSSSLVGQLQVGGMVGTMNGMFGLDILSTPYIVGGGGWAQGGSPGAIFGLTFNPITFGTLVSNTLQGLDPNAPKAHRGTVADLIQ